MTAAAFCSLEGRNALVTCVVRMVSGKPRVKCKVTYRRSSRAVVRARLLRSGHVLASRTVRSRGRNSSIELGRHARLQQGRYRLRLQITQGGETWTVVRSIRVG